MNDDPWYASKELDKEEYFDIDSRLYENADSSGSTLVEVPITEDMGLLQKELSMSAQMETIAMMV